MRSGLLCCRHVNKTFALITVGQRKLLRNDLGRELQHCKINLRYILKIFSTVLIEHLQLGYPFILCHSYFFKFIKRTKLKKFPAKKNCFLNTSTEKGVHKRNDFSFNSTWFVLHTHSRYIYIRKKNKLTKKEYQFQFRIN